MTSELNSESTGTPETQGTEEKSKRKSASVEPDKKSAAVISDKKSAIGMSESNEAVSASGMAVFKCGQVAIVGRPNVGKSTLMNTILGAHLSIVTPKPQTTRKRVLGIHSANDTQMIFIDTPGILKPRYRMQRTMMEYVHQTLQESDVVCVIIDAVRGLENKSFIDPMIDEVLVGVTTPIILVINKMDAISVPSLIPPLIEEMRVRGAFAKAVAVSALENKEVDALLEILSGYMPESPFLYDADQLSSLPERFFVAELVREVIFERFKDEIPYSTDVTVIEFKERERGKWLIAADIYVERDTQKAIIIGSGASALKDVGMAARQRIEAHLGAQVYLELFVKVRADWRNDPAQLMNLGY